MKNLTFACALLSAVTSAMSIGAQSQPRIEINISGVEDMQEHDGDEVIEINIDMDEEENDDGAVDINFGEGSDAEEGDDFDTPFQNFDHQLDHTEDIYDNHI